MLCHVCAAGGLQEAVAALKEALVLPVKYGHLLATAPLRLRTGEVLDRRVPETQSGSRI
jgi:hypothetical protein